MPRAKSKKSEITRQKLLQAAYGLFRKKGFEGTSVREITEAAEVSKGTFYLYFETKFDILKTYGVDFLMRFQAIAQELQSADVTQYRRHIEMIIYSIVREMKEHRSSILLMHASEVSQMLAGTDLGERFEDMLTEPIASYIKRGIAAGVFRNMDPRFYARIIIMLCHDLLEGAILYEYPGDIESVSHELCEIILRILETQGGS